MITSNEDGFKIIYDYEFSKDGAFKRITIWKSLLGHYIIELICNFKYDRSFGYRATTNRLDLDCEQFTTFIEYPNLLDSTKDYDVYVKEIKNNNIRIAFLKL